MNFSYRKAAFVAGLVLAGLTFAIAGGPSPRSQKPETKNPAAAEKRYPLTGRVVSVDKANHSVNIDGDEIPGFMAAMTMPYSVKDASILEKLSTGDRIKAEIVVGDEDAYLENIVVAAKPTPRK
jgi:protein SCO1/2